MILSARTRPPSAEDVLHCSHLDLAHALAACGQKVDAVIVDAPYSERTHAGHDDGSSGAREDVYRGRASKRGEAAGRRELPYKPWTDDDVWSFVEAWSAVCRGWLVSLTDHVLAPAWEAALEEHGLYSFAPVACMNPGSRVRLTGDGPSQWSVWLVVARPRSRAFASWGALPGGYVIPGGQAARSLEGNSVVGGKPIALMRALVRDYTRPGDLACDPCAGAGTTLLAAKLEGRHAIGCDIDAAHVELARERLRDLPTADKRGTRSLFADRDEAAE